MTDGSKFARIIHDGPGRTIRPGPGRAMLVCAVLCLAAILVSIILVAPGCRGPKERQTSGGAAGPVSGPPSPAATQPQPQPPSEDEPIPYPAALSQGSSPREVATLLIKALDEWGWEHNMLAGLADAEAEAEEISAVHNKYGTPQHVSVTDAAGNAVGSWYAVYKAFEAGATRIVDAAVHPATADSPETATVIAKVIQPEIAHPRYITIRLVRRNGLWKVRSGLEVSDTQPSP